MEYLDIARYDLSGPPGQGGVDPSAWRELLRPFTAVKDLSLCSVTTPHVALVLQELVRDSVMELFPILQNIFLSELHAFGFVPEGIEQFVAARQLAGHPISVFDCDDYSSPGASD